MLRTEAGALVAHEFGWAGANGKGGQASDSSPQAARGRAPSRTRGARLLCPPFPHAPCNLGSALAPLRPEQTSQKRSAPRGRWVSNPGGRRGERKSRHPGRSPKDGGLFVSGRSGATGVCARRKSSYGGRLNRRGREKQNSTERRLPGPADCRLSKGERSPEASL